MNRIIISLSMLILIGCMDTESIDTPSYYSAESSFSVSVSTSTESKGALINSPEYMESIGVFCALTGDEIWSTTTVFEKLYNRRFNITSNGDWIIDGQTEYWGYKSQSDNYTIYAYSPYYNETNGIVASTENGALVINYKMPSNSANQPDLMYAMPQKNIQPQIDGSVPLTFYHSLASIGFSVLSSSDVKITAVDITNIISEGSLTWDSSNTPVWVREDPSKEQFIVDMTEYEVDMENPVQINSDYGYLMMIPQVLESEAEVNISFNNYTQTTLTIQAGSEWKAGVTYNYVIKLDDSDDDCNDDDDDDTGGNFIFNSQQISNCYIINPTEGQETVVQIPIEDRINDFWMNYYGRKNAMLDSTTNILELGVNMLWEDFEDDVDFTSTLLRDDDGKVAVSLTMPAINQEGNFVFTVTNSSSTVLWSWHLWFTDYNPDKIASANINNILEGVDTAYTLSGYEGAVHRYIDGNDEVDVWSTTYKNKFIMDRNIGERNEYASDYGAGSVYYQFGRKDPFPGSGALYFNGNIDPTPRVASNDNFEVAVKAPYKFNCKDISASGNWSGETAARFYNVIWFDQDILKENYSTGKSIFDPSPYGWRVPVKDTWSSFSSPTSCGSDGIYNKYGYRDPTNYATLDGTTEISYVWSCTPADTEYGYCFSQTGTASVCPDSMYMSYGLPVRAIQE